MSAVVSSISDATITAEPDIRVQTISDPQAFLDLEPIWNHVAEAAGTDHPFLEFSWALSWWEAFGKDSQLHILVLWSGSKPIALAPLLLDSIRILGVPLRRLGFFYNSHVPRADFLIASHHDAVYHSIWKHLSEERSWDVLQLCQLAEGSPTRTALAALAENDGYPTGKWQSGVSPYIPLSRAWQEYTDDLPRKHRSNLRNRFKRLSQVAPVELETVAAEGNLPEALEAGFGLEAAAWKGSAGTSISQAPDLTKFYAEFARRAAGRGWLRLHFLRTGTQRVAFDYSIAYKDQLFLLKLGYDPTFSAYSPSNLLVSLALEDSFARGLTRYDFLGDFADWKRCWASAGVPYYWLYIFRNTLQGHLLRHLKFRTVPALKRLGRRG